MTADHFDSTRSGGRVLGALGLGLWVLGLIIGFVVAVEYDPEAADFRAVAERMSGTVTVVEDDRIVATVDDRTAFVALDPTDAGRFEPGDPVSLLVLPGQSEGARLEEDVAATPRRAGAFLVPAVILLLAALAVSSDPAVLYPTERGSV